MMLAFDHLDASHQRLSRWSGAAGVVVALHVGAVALALWSWPSSEPEPQDRPGAIMLELPALAAESASDQTDLADSPEMTQAAPPPSPADEPQLETPAEPAPAEEKVAEAPQPAPLPPVDEAPLAPEPEVALPKVIEPAPDQPKEVEEKAEKKVEPKPEKKAEKKADAKPAPKSDSKQQQKAAASAAGKFDPNPTYRAKPAYPSSALAGKIEGSVVVSYSVSPSGSVTSVRVVSASAGMFSSAALSAVRQWRFKPSSQGGTRTTTIRFKLK
jgi:protein TonB